jgi:hypothetical protein
MRPLIYSKVITAEFSDEATAFLEPGKTPGPQPRYAVRMACRTNSSSTHPRERGRIIKGDRLGLAGSINTVSKSTPLTESTLITESTLLLKL